jgi:hypothetical protein
MDEVEHFMNIRLQEGDAKKELLSIKQRQGGASRNTITASGHYGRKQR